MNEFTITQLTDNDVDDSGVQTSKGNAVWTASDGNDDEIFIYDGDSARQLTFNKVFDSSPQISGDNLTWLQTESDPLFSIFGGSKVTVYDGASETIETIAEVDSLTIPAISGNNVVWGEDFIFGGTISLYDGSDISELTDLGVFIPISGSVFGSNIVWASGFDDDFEGYGDIFLYDGRTTTQITDNASDGFVNILPSVSRDNIAWTGSEIDATGSETAGDIFFYDGETEETIQLTDDDVLDVVVGVSGNNVIWSSGESDLESELFLYDGEKTIQLTSNKSDIFGGASISGDDVVWSESDGNDTEIFLYDGTETIQITDNDTDDNAPDINQGTIVWEGDDGNDTEIFLATVDENEVEVEVEEQLFLNEDFTGADDGVERIGTFNDELLRGGSGDDLFFGVSGADTLRGGGGDDGYIVSLTSNGGTIIRDTAGLDIVLIVAENTDISGIGEGLYDLDDPAPYGDAAVTLSLPERGIVGLEKSGTDLIIDTNRDGVAEVEDDLTIINYFDGRGNLGLGAVELINNLDDSQDIVDFFADSALT